MELFDLGADVIVSKLLKKSAQKALDVNAFTPNIGVDQVQYDEMIKTLEGLAEVKVNALKSIKKIKFIYRGFSKKFDDHLNRGQITIKKKNAQNEDIDLAESYDYATGLGGKEPSAFVPPWQAKVNVSGVHRYTNIDNKLIKINKVEDVKKLPTGEVVEILRIEIFVKELNKFVKKKDISTMWPKNWSMQKIKRMTKEASQNVFWNQGNKFRGISADGNIIEFFSKNDGIIENSYLFTDHLKNIEL